MKLYKTPGIFKRMYPDFLWHQSHNEKVIYLTFDDGPTPKITHWVLETLDKFNAKATFFCLGQEIEAHSNIFEEIIQKKHTIGNHSYSHLKGRKTNSGMYLNDFEQFEKTHQTTLFRPPYGSIKPKQAKEISKTHQIVMWDVLAYDWETDLNLEKALEKIIQATKNGSIVTFHDSNKASTNLQYLLPKYLNHFSKLGYQFKAL